jgi:hypothetical protein
MPNLIYHYPQVLLHFPVQLLHPPHLNERHLVGHCWIDLIEHHSCTLEVTKAQRRHKIHYTGVVFEKHKTPLRYFPVQKDHQKVHCIDILYQ